MTKWFAPEVRAAAVRRRVEGERVTDIAADVGASVGAVYRWCRVAGFATQRIAKPSAPERRDAVRRHLAGESLSGVARSIGRKAATVAAWVEAAGHTPQRRRYGQDVKAAVLARVEAGESVPALARDTGIDPTTINLWRRRSLHRAGQD